MKAKFFKAIVIISLAGNVFLASYIWFTSIGDGDLAIIREDFSFLPGIDTLSKRQVLHVAHDSYLEFSQTACLVFDEPLQGLWRSTEMEEHLPRDWKIHYRHEKSGVVVLTRREKSESLEYDFVCIVAPPQPGDNYIYMLRVMKHDL